VRLFDNDQVVLKWAQGNVGSGSRRSRTSSCTSSRPVRRNRLRTRALPKHPSGAHSVEPRDAPPPGFWRLTPKRKRLRYFTTRNRRSVSGSASPRETRSSSIGRSPSTPYIVLIGEFAKELVEVPLSLGMQVHLVLLNEDGANLATQLAKRLNTATTTAL
jgi:hypothetical protein